MEIPTCKPSFPAGEMPVVCYVKFWIYVYSDAGREVFTSVMSRVIAVSPFDGLRYYKYAFKAFFY